MAASRSVVNSPMNEMADGPFNPKAQNKKSAVNNKPDLIFPSRELKHE